MTEIDIVDKTMDTPITKEQILAMAADAEKEDSGAVVIKKEFEEKKDYGPGELSEPVEPVYKYVVPIEDLGDDIPAKPFVPTEDHPRPNEWKVTLSKPKNEFEEPEKPQVSRKRSWLQRASKRQAMLAFGGAGALLGGVLGASYGSKIHTLVKIMSV